MTVEKSAEIAAIKHVIESQICRKAANSDSWLGSNASKMKPWLLWHWTTLSCTEWWPVSLSKYFAGKLTNL